PLSSVLYGTTLTLVRGAGAAGDAIRATATLPIGRARGAVRAGASTRACLAGRDAALATGRCAALAGAALATALAGTLPAGAAFAGEDFSAATFFTGAFLTGAFFATAFLAAAFFTGAFFATAFLATAFFAGAAFFATTFLAAAFLTGAFLAGAFFATAFFAATFFTGAFFAAPFPATAFFAAFFTGALAGVFLEAALAAFFGVFFEATVFRSSSSLETGKRAVIPCGDHTGNLARVCAACRPIIVIARLLIALLRGYKRWLSPLLGPRCRFVPTCSEYAMTAIARFGALKG